MWVREKYELCRACAFHGVKKNVSPGNIHLLKPLVAIATRRAEMEHAGSEVINDVVLAQLNPTDIARVANVPLNELSAGRKRLDELGDIEDDDFLVLSAKFLGEISTDEAKTAGYDVAHEPLLTRCEQ